MCEAEKKLKKIREVIAKYEKSQGNRFDADIMHPIHAFDLIRAIMKRVRKMDQPKSKGISIPSEWAHETGDWDRSNNRYINRHLKPYPARQILVQVEDRGGEDVLHFLNGPTGHESYYLKDLMEFLQEGVKTEPDHETLSICAGTINSWPRCAVLRKHVVQALKELGKL